VARDEIMAHNSRLRRDVVEREGTDANVLVSAMVAVGDEVVLHLQRLCAGQFIDSARKEALRRLVFDRYGLSAQTASPALCSVSFSTAAANPAAFSIPAGTKLVTSDGKQFATLSAALFPAGSTGPVSVPARSVLAGLSQQVAPGKVVNISDFIPGAPGDLAVTNPLASSGAADAEEDEDFRARAKSFFSTARRGTSAAIKQAALGVAGVRRASVFEAVDELGRPARWAQLIIADQFTDALVLAEAPAGYAAQSQVLADTVFAALDDVRACGIFVDVVVAQVILQGVQLSLCFDAGAAVDTVALKARAAVVTYVNGLAPGAPFVPADCVEQLRLVPGLIVTGAEVVSPAGQVQPERLQVLRTTLSLVTVPTVVSTRALQSGSASSA
jgi:hypothetical protein